MTSVPRQRLGIANKMLAMTRTVGNLAGMALLGTFFYCRLKLHVGQPIEMALAPARSFVGAFHDQMHLANRIVLVGLVVALRQAMREGRAEIREIDSEVESGELAEDEL